MSGEKIDQLLGDDDKKKMTGLNRSGGFLGFLCVGFFVLCAFLAVGTIFVAVVTTTAKSYISKPKWLRQSEVIIPRRQEINYIYTPEITLSGRTNDGSSYIYDVALVFGFIEKNKVVDIELARRSLELKDLLRGFFSIRTARDLRASNEKELKILLLNEINSFLKKGKIEEVLFLQLDVN